MNVHFEKWHGCKNDFIVIWASVSQYKNLGPSLVRQSVQLCDRHSGVGADGIIILIHSNTQERPDTAVILNSDGSLAQTCGNGIRCAALSVYTRSLEKIKTPLEFLELKVENLTYTCQFLPQKGSLPLVQVNMGVAKLDEQNSWHKKALDFVGKKLNEKNLSILASNVHTVSLANQHLVFLLEEELDLALMRDLGRLLQNSSEWDGINVSFVSELKQNVSSFPLAMQSLETSEAYKVFIWERGAGETQACGSAACAIGVSLLSPGWISREAWVPMFFPGGYLFAKQNSQDEEVLLSGPGKFVFSGDFSL